MATSGAGVYFKLFLIFRFRIDLYIKRNTCFILIFQPVTRTSLIEHTHNASGVLPDGRVSRAMGLSKIDVHRAFNSGNLLARCHTRARHGGAKIFGPCAERKTNLDKYLSYSCYIKFLSKYQCQFAI